MFVNSKESNKLPSQTECPTRDPKVTSGHEPLRNLFRPYISPEQKKTYVVVEKKLIDYSKYPNVHALQRLFPKLL